MRTRELPAALPPAERTVGQVVAETLRAYGGTFWRALPLGVPLAVSSQLSLGRSPSAQMLTLLAFAPLIALAFVYACALVLHAQPTATALLLGLLVFAPIPLLARIYILPALAWLALFGLAPAAAMKERLGFRAALGRARRLGSADYVHALGSLAALVIVVAASEFTLIALLRSQGDSGERVAHALADLVVSPILYLGGALLYFDQAARVGSRSHRTTRIKTRRRDAALHPPLDPDPAGRADPEVEP